MAPVDNSPANDMGNFEHVCSLKSNDTVSVHKYKSKKTGLTVYIADVEGPVVCGYFCLATEAHDDDGLPHTLEHLIFLGSENYPYKGVLDLLANRCLASGTNASTDVDNTFYTIETVGSEGFLALLPIYIDHILYPTLTESAYCTEVHHIDGNGADAGVVYCEMEARVNVGEELVYKALQKAIYPGKCGYKSCVGGELKNLRESTSNEKVKDYHRDFYRPENLYIIITGQVKHIDVFKALQATEEKIISKGPKGLFKRPWQNPVPPLTESVNKTIYYPCNDDDNGMAWIGWRGPSAVTNKYDIIALCLLFKYFTDNAASPLQKVFVETDDAYASSVGYSFSENSESMILLTFDNVPKSKVNLIKSVLDETLKNISNSEDGIDLQRMRAVIHRYMLEILSNLESCPHESVAFMIIGDVLFGNNNEDLKKRLNEIEEIKKLKLEPLSFWKSLLQKYLISAPSVVIIGIPSVEKLTETTEEEKKRIAKQIESLGPNGLKQKEKELQEAIAQNEREIPDEVLTSIPIPSTESVKFHNIKRYNTESAEQHPKFNLNKLPFYACLDHLNTNFIYMFVIMDTREVPIETRPYIPLLLESLLESPIIRDGVLIPYENVIEELESDTIAVSTRLGINGSARFYCGSYSHKAVLALQLELSKYEKGIQWIKDLLYQTKITSERLKIISSKIINDVSQVKRQGDKIADDLIRGLLYKKESNRYTSSMLRQQQLLTKMLEQMNTTVGQEEVILKMEAVRNILTSPKNIMFYTAVNVDKLAGHVPDVYSPWMEFFPNTNDSSKTKSDLIQDYEYIMPLSEISTPGCVTGVGCIESAYLYQCCAAINDFMSPDFAALKVCLKYFTQLEGPMWKQIRGQGLAYSYNVYLSPNEGLLYLSLYRATNAVAAYQEAKKIIESCLADNKWDPILLDSAKCSLIFEIFGKEKSIGDAVLQSLLSYFKKLPEDYNRKLIKQIFSVTTDDLNRVAKLYLKNLFDPVKSKMTIVCNSSKASEIAKNFKTFNYNLQVYNNLEETYLNDW